MTDPQSSQTAFVLGSTYYSACLLVEEFVRRTVRPIAERANQGTPEHLTYLGALLRVLGWLGSTKKLNDPADFQPILTGSRAVFEIAVDLVLMKHDSSTPCAQLLAWEDSAKLKAAERVQKRYSPGPMPTKHAAQETFIRTETSRIHALRAKYWGGKHPARWTGRHLDVDAYKADTFDSCGFAEYYDERYPQVCWNVHGSGLAGVRNITPDLFPALAGLALIEIAFFSVIGTRAVLQLLDRYDSITQHRYDQLSVELSGNSRAAWESFHAVQG